MRLGECGMSEQRQAHFRIDCALFELSSPAFDLDSKCI